MIQGPATMPAATSAASSPRIAPSTTPAVCSALAPVRPVDGVDHDRHEHRLEHAGGEQLEQDVRDRVRRLVGVAEVRRSEHRGDDDDPDEAGPTADAVSTPSTARCVPTVWGPRLARIVGRFDQRRLRPRVSAGGRAAVIPRGRSGTAPSHPRRCRSDPPGPIAVRRSANTRARRPFASSRSSTVLRRSALSDSTQSPHSVSPRLGSPFVVVVVWPSARGARPRRR